jgi:hypothetical protein
VTHYDSRDDGRDDQATATVPRLFDLRTIIGAMFTLYGVVLVITGLVDKASDLTKSNGIRINLWLGLCMLGLGLLFLLWVRVRPLRLEAPSAAAQVESEARTDAMGRTAPADESDTGPDESEVGPRDRRPPAR